MSLCRRTAYIGLGSNLGDRIQTLINARQAVLSLDEVFNLQSSDFYLSSPVGYSDQPDFINCVIRLETSYSALQLLSHLQSVELAFARQRDSRNRNAPRTLDLDMLLYDQQIITTEKLTVPHPRLHQRLFVLMPLNELCADLQIPNLGSVATLIKANTFADQQLFRLH